LRHVASATCTLLGVALIVAVASAGKQSDPADPSALPPTPTVASPAWAVYDGVDGTLLAADGAESARPIASLTKLMTALLVVERTQGDEPVRISKRASQTNEGSAIGMQPGDTYPVDDLLRAMLVYSTNDAAVALAEHVSGDIESFIELMNDRADQLELGDTTYTSVNGLDEKGVEPTESSPADLVTLATTALKDPRIRDAVRTERLTIDRPSGDPAVFVNRNTLLGTYAGVDGVKTGFTDSAGNTLLTHYGDQSERDFFVVTLGAKTDKQRFDDTRKLLDWAVPLRDIVPIAEAGTPIGSAPILGGGDVELYISDDIDANVRAGQALVERVVVPRRIEPPLRAGDEVGTYEVLAGDEVVGTSPIYVDKDVAKPTRADRAKDVASNWRDALDSAADFAADSANSAWDALAGVE
jgi:D-alanyl-D-alanine carboxypeptidase (penicillin-binding protein 5/6)